MEHIPCDMPQRYAPPRPPAPPPRPRRRPGAIAAERWQEGSVCGGTLARMSSRRAALTLSDDQLVAAFMNMYAQGAFPMAEPPSIRERGKARAREPEVHWYRPDPRAILPLQDGALRVWDGLARARKKRAFVFTADACFDRVIRACAEPGAGRGGPGETWLSPALIECYLTLHRHQRAHSIEAWLLSGESADPGRGGFVAEVPETATLVGGIYGVSIGAAFFAESMFSRPALGGSNASSLCLVHLWHHLRARGYTLLDVQISNHHTAQFGVTEIAASAYQERLEEAIARPCAWGMPPGAGA